MARLIDRTYVANTTIGLDIQNVQYGVFAAEDIKKGEIIMECVIPFEWLYKNTKAMRSYRMGLHDKKAGYLGDYVPLGNSMVVNEGQGNKQSLFWLADMENRILRGTAIKDIKKDEEILWDYTHQYPPDPLT